MLTTVSKPRRYRLLYTVKLPTAQGKPTSNLSKVKATENVSEWGQNVPEDSQLRVARVSADSHPQRHHFYGLISAVTRLGTYALS